MLRTASAPTYNLLRDCIAARSAFKAEKQEYGEEEYDIKTSEKKYHDHFDALAEFHRRTPCV